MSTLDSVWYWPAIWRANKTIDWPVTWLLTNTSVSYLAVISYKHDSMSWVHRTRAEITLFDAHLHSKPAAFYAWQQEGRTFSLTSALVNTESVDFKIDCPLLSIYINTVLKYCIVDKPCHINSTYTNKFLCKISNHPTFLFVCFFWGEGPGSPKNVHQEYSVIDYEGGEGNHKSHCFKLTARGPFTAHMII